MVHCARQASLASQVASLTAELKSCATERGTRARLEKQLAQHTRQLEEERAQHTRQLEQLDSQLEPLSGQLEEERSARVRERAALSSQMESLAAMLGAFFSEPRK